MRKHVRLLGGALVSLALVAAACGGNGTGSGDATGSGGANVTGSVKVSGSSTVLPISQLVAEEFSGNNPDVQISVDGPGTTDGFVLFCKGQTDINDASRQIKDEEIQACKDKGINYVELEIGLDGITVMTNPANDAVTCLSKADLYSLIGPESKNFNNWSDANALDKELGGNGNFPDAPLDLVGPGQESGTWGSFIDLALKDIADARSQPNDTTRPDYQTSGDDNVIIRGVEESNSSLGWVGFAYAEENAQNVKILGVSPATDASGEGASDCVTPSRDTISDGSYPLSRSLYLYVNTAKIGDNAALKAFVDFYMSNTGIADGVQKAGYVDIPADRIAATRSPWELARGGASGSWCARPGAGARGGPVRPAPVRRVRFGRPDGHGNGAAVGR
jgi:phosphate transport system substrate-binding protein